MNLTISEAAERSNVTREVLNNACTRGDLPYTTEMREVRPGCVIEVRVVAVGDLERFTASVMEKRKSRVEKERLRMERIRQGGPNRRIAAHEAAELYYYSLPTITRAIHQREIPAERELRFIESQGRNRWVYVVNTKDVEAWILRPRSMGRPRLKRETASGQKQTPTLYKEYRAKGKIPPHLREPLLEFVREVEAEIWVRKRLEQREVAM